MFENIVSFFKKFGKKEQKEVNSKDTAKERLHLVLMQDRANVSADFLDMMRQEIIEVIKKYIDVDEAAERRNIYVSDRRWKNIVRRLRTVCCQLADLIRNHRKASSCFSCSGSFNGSIQG